MKKQPKYFLYVLIFVSLFLLSETSVASPSLGWNTFLGGNGQHLGYGITVDSSGNVYTVGLHNTNWNTGLFGNPVSNGVQGGASDGAVAKLDSSGNVLWYRFFGGSTNDALSGVKVDSNGNVYVIGYAFGAFTFNPNATPTPVHAYVGGDIDIFVAKLDNNGALIWYTYLGSTSNDYVYGLDIDAAGNIYIGGESYRTWHASFDNVKGTNKSSDGYQGYIAKLNNNGVYQWHRFLTTYGVYDVDADNTGYVYSVKKGLFYAGAWNYPAEVGKYDANTGAQSWSVQLGNGTHDGFGIKVGADGSVYVKGVSSQSWGTPIRAYSSGNDAYVAKLNNGGTLQWNTFLGGSGNDNCRSSNACTLSLDLANNIYVTGFSTASWGIPSIAFGGGTSDGFVAMLDNSGNLVWNLFLGGTNTDQCTALAASVSGNIYVTGYTQQTSWGTPVDFPTNCYYCQSVAKINNPISVGLTVSKSGTGNGTVISSPIGINCGNSCSEDFDSDTTVTLTATAASGSTFSGWSGAGCSGTGSCIVIIENITLVTASFAVVPIPTPIQNSAPRISDQVNQTTQCALTMSCYLPTWTVSDDDDDDNRLTAFWEQVGGSNLRITNSGAIDLVNNPTPRGTYYVNYKASDGASTTTSQMVTVTVPNNIPYVESRGDDLGIQGARYWDSKYLINEFKKDIDITANFTDLDADNLSYSWAVVGLSNDAWAGFVSTSAGASKLRSRVAGDLKVIITADDGYGGVTTEEMIISIPVPEINEEDLDLITATEVLGDTMTVSGSFVSPVWPVVSVNGVSATDISLDVEADMSALVLAAEAEDDTTTSAEVYSFTVTDIPVSSDLDVEIYTPVNGENVFLVEKSITNSPNSPTTTNTTEISSSGCRLSVSKTTSPFLTIFLIVFFGVLFLGKQFLSQHACFVNDLKKFYSR